jgi:hypothetical protein
MVNIEYLTWYILSAVVPFYENVEGIESKVKEWAEEDDLVYRGEDIRHALEELINSGMVEIWVLASTSAENRRAAYVKEQAEHLWFYISSKGQESLESLTKKLSGKNPSENA